MVNEEGESSQLKKVEGGSEHNDFKKTGDTYILRRKSNLMVV